MAPAHCMVPAGTSAWIGLRDCNIDAATISSTFRVARTRNVNQMREFSFQELLLPTAQDDILDLIVAIAIHQAF